MATALPTQPTGRRLRTIVVTGARSQVGRCLVGLLGDQPSRVLTVDSRGNGGLTDLDVDLTSPSGRSAMLAWLEEATGGVLDAVVATTDVDDAGAAGDGEPVAVQDAYFGVVAAIAGLRPLLARGHQARAVAVSASPWLLNVDGRLVEACLTGDEYRAIERAERLNATGRGSLVLPSTGAALNRWLRRHALTHEWAGQGILLNAVAGGAANPREVAALAAELASPQNQVVTGAVVTATGGSHVALRGDPVW